MRKYIWFTFLLFLISCTEKKVFINRNSDFQELKIFVEEFYKNSGSNHLNIKYFSEDFFKATDKNELKKFINFMDSVGGKIKDKYVVSWYCEESGGIQNTSTYGIECYIIRENINTQEIFEFSKNNKSLQIEGYRINLDVENKLMDNVPKQ